MGGRSSSRVILVVATKTSASAATELNRIISEDFRGIIITPLGALSFYRYSSSDSITIETNASRSFDFSVV
jgi:hypothetical protein